MPDPYLAFTVSSNSGLLHCLKTTVTVVNNTEMEQFPALWDTGATGTCISHDVVDKLHLTPIGKMSIQTPTGPGIVNTYIVSIILPNAVTVKDALVCDSEIGDQGLGVLIGMDIITLGDFSISNLNKKTVFSFRIPSVVETDYVKESMNTR